MIKESILTRNYTNFFRIKMQFAADRGSLRSEESRTNCVRISYMRYENVSN